MKHVVIILLVAACAVGCATSSRQTMVLDYGDFGPSAASHELLGVAWWQWKSCGGSCMGTDHGPVNVVVYRDIPLSAVKKAYPVVEEKEQDFRYVSYSEAMQYLDATIQETESFLPELSDELTQMKHNIMKKLGNPTTASTATNEPALGGSI